MCGYSTCMATASPNLPGIDAFHRERSKCIDAFAETEEAVMALLRLTGIKLGTEPFKQKSPYSRKPRLVSNTAIREKLKSMNC